MKPIDVIATYPRDGLPIPHRYRIADTDGSTQVIKVDRILYRTEGSWPAIECSFTGARASLPAAGGL